MTQRNPNPLRDEWLTRKDGCPECMARDNEPTMAWDVPGGIECEYLCPVCGGVWRTSWWVS